MIRWHDNVPILSWLLLRARCRKCRAPISSRYPFVEALTGALFLLVAWRHPPPDGLALAAVEAIFLAALVAVTFIDIDHRIIPDRITKPGIALALLAGLLVPELHSPTCLAEIKNRNLAGLLEGLAGALVGAGVILFVRFVGTWILKKEAMGLGDAKLLAMIGALTSPVKALYVLLVGSVGGAVLGAVYVVARTKSAADVEGSLATDDGVETKFTRARVTPDRLWIVAPSSIASGSRVRVRLTLAADALWEEKDANLTLTGVVEVARKRAGGALVVVRLDEPASNDADALRTFALIRRYIPFGPFLALGGAAMLAYGDEVIRFFTVTWPQWVAGGRG